MTTEELAIRNEKDLALDEMFQAMNSRFDEAESTLAQEFGAVENPPYPLNHYFTPGLYVREILLPAGSILTSKIHLTEHPFILSAGEAVVWSPDQGTVYVKAPFVGITKPGTRRIIYATTDCVWLTCHATEETDLNVIEKSIIMQRVNPKLQNALPASNDKP